MSHAVEQDQYSDDGLRQGQHDAQVVANVAAAVDFRGVQHLAGDAVLDKGFGDDHVIA